MICVKHQFAPNQRNCNEDWSRQNSPRFVWPNHASKGNFLGHLHKGCLLCPAISGLRGTAKGVGWNISWEVSEEHDYRECTPGLSYLLRQPLSQPFSPQTRFFQPRNLTLIFIMLQACIAKSSSFCPYSLDKTPPSELKRSNFTSLSLWNWVGTKKVRRETPTMSFQT